MQEMKQVWSLGQEDPLKKKMATHSSILAWEIPWAEEPSRLSPWGHKESDMTEWLSIHTYTHKKGSDWNPSQQDYWPWDMEYERNKESRMTSSFLAQSAGGMESLVAEIWKTVAGGSLQVEDWGICLRYDKFDLSIRHQSRSVNRQ